MVKKYIAWQSNDHNHQRAYIFSSSEISNTATRTMCQFSTLGFQIYVKDGQKDAGTNINCGSAHWKNTRTSPAGHGGASVVRSHRQRAVNRNDIGRSKWYLESRETLSKIGISIETPLLRIWGLGLLRGGFSIAYPLISNFEHREHVKKPMIFLVFSLQIAISPMFARFP